MSRVVFGPAAEALFRLSGPTAVSAGAGSGKTTALIELLLRLLDGRATGAPCGPAEVAAVTFTEKAAEELRTRLRGAVAGRAREAASAEERREWLLRLHGLDRLFAGTIHGFCGRLLRDHAPEAGLDPEFRVLDEERSWAWLRDAAREAVVAALDQGRPLSRAWSAAPGAGTRGLSAWVAGLVKERATRGQEGPPRLAEAAPGAGAAARESLLGAAERLLAHRGQALRPGPAALVEAVGRALEALRPEDREGPPTLPGLARLEALADAAEGAIGRGGPASLFEAREALQEAAQACLAAAAEELAGPQRAELAALVAGAEGRYAARKAAGRAVDFDDLLLRARGLLAGDHALRAELRRGLRAVLVDEFQDVNPVQQSLFELLCSPGPGEEPGPVLVAVGDPKQSIYRFRGADVAVFTRLLRAFGAGEGRVLHLSDNHRSAPAVLDLVNAVSERTLQPPAGQAPRDDELAFGPADRLLPRRPEGARPACELLVDPGPGKSAERRAREARAIAARIRRAVEEGAGLEVRERDPQETRAPHGPEDAPERLRPPRYGDVAVLFRRLTQVGPYQRALRRAGIPFRMARGGGFYQASEVRDLGELLAALADPDDALAWAALLRSPLCAVSDGSLYLLSRVGLARLHRLSPAELRAELGRAAGGDTPGGAGVAALLPEAEALRLDRFLAVFRELARVRDRVPVPALLRRAVEALDLDAALLAGPEGEQRAANVEKALALAERFAAEGAGGAELAAHLRAMAALPPREPEADLEAADAVALLTIHQAKGLEWPVVFVPDLGMRAPTDARRALLDGEGRLCTELLDPAGERFLATASHRAALQGERRALSAESRRLLYVALTRARDRLVLSGEGNGESWRALLDGALAGREDLVLRSPLAELAAEPEAVAAPPGPEAAFRARASTGPARAEAGPAPLPPRLPGPAPLPAVRLAVTELAELLRCPRRHLLGRVLGIPEPRGPAEPPGDDPARATTRGTLAHAMLAEVDLAAPPLERRAQLAAAAARRGYDPQSPGPRRIVSEVMAFAGSPAGRRLAAAGREGRLSREVPFLLRLGGAEPPAVYLAGALDALVRGPRGELTVIDYKYATPRPESAARYRLQLAAYALAATRAHPGARVRAALQFLRGDLRTLDLTPTAEELSRLEALAPGLARGAALREEPTPAALGRDEASCRAEGCGYVGRCYGRTRS